MNKTTWTVGERTGEVKAVLPAKLPHVPAFEITDKMPKNQAASAKNWNDMRERLIELNQMESR